METFTVLRDGAVSSSNYLDPATHLPVELFTLIVKCVCFSPGSSSVRVKLALGSISSIWRQIIWSTPLLWNDWNDESFLPETRSIGTNSGILQSFHLHSSNAQPSPIFISITRAHHPDILLPLSFYIFSEHSNRMRSIKFLEIDEQTWEAIINNSRHSDFPLLESITLRFNRKYGKRQAASLDAPFPLLQDLSLDHPTHCDIEKSFPWVKLPLSLSVAYTPTWLFTSSPTAIICENLRSINPVCLVLCLILYPPLC